jgi:glycine cleavage system aminomethyltransferase T
MRPYRQWLKPTSYEAMASLGGSFRSDNIADYYLTPWDLGYGQFVRFDHDFVGRAALGKDGCEPDARRSRWYGTERMWSEALGSLFANRSGDIAKYIDLPLANYATLPYDRVTSGNRTIGLSTYTGYNFNERAMLSLAILDNEHSEPGTQVTLTWGEENGGTTKADGGAS